MNSSTLRLAILALVAVDVSLLLVRIVTLVVNSATPDPLATAELGAVTATVGCIVWLIHNLGGK